ncbi:MAG: methylenetetrahydrofolate reductase [NAD(P)H] [Paludibacteraceae bacterium]|nr:methylenetetrahydrofolate reductase [NAD(P)H] [Paludibacteraceae bacterium]
MSVSEFLTSKHETAFSFEVLPPLRGKGIDQVYNTIERLLPYNPQYINITTHRTDISFKEMNDGRFQRVYEHKRPGTVAIAAAIKSKYNIPTVPHVICSGYSATELENELIDLSYLGITDLIVLRGDRAKGENSFTPANGGHLHATDLCKQIKDFNQGNLIDGTTFENIKDRQFSFGVAGYPEKHEEAMNLNTDLEYLRQKVELGASYIVTQMFFDNKKYFNYVQRLRDAGINIPVIPGIKPLTSLRQQSILPNTFHIDFPDELASEFLKCKTNDEVKSLGIEWAITQAKELKAANVPSLHFYTMNATASIEEIVKKVY